MSSLTLSHASCKKRKVVNVVLLDGEQIQVFVDGYDAVGQPLLTVHFRVQFYVDQIVLLREKVTRHLYYLQLKENVLNYGHLCSEEKSFQIASYALQADFGNYNPSKHGQGYFDPREYFPAWKKKFEIRSVGSPEGRKFTYFTDCDTKSKYLLHLCRTTHMFQMAIQPKLMEIRHLDAEDKRRYRESYIYSDTRDLVANGGSFRGSLSPVNKLSTTNQRYSVISDASSNTTSGIASEKMTISFEDSDDHSNLCKEIMVDCPVRSDTMPSSKSSRNRSPVLDSRPTELYKSASVGRPGGSKRNDRSPTYNRPTSVLPPSPGIRHSDKSSSVPSAITGGGNMVNVASVLRGDSDISQSMSYNNSSSFITSRQDVEISPNNSFNSGFGSVSQSQPPMLQDIAVSASPYTGPRTVPVYIAHTPVSSFSTSDNLTFSQPVSRSTSRADSFKNTIGHLHPYEGGQVPPISDPYSGQYLDTLAGNLVYANYPVHTGINMSVQSTAVPITAVSNFYDPVYTGSDHLDEHSSSEYLEGDLAPPPPMFADISSAQESQPEVIQTSNLGMVLPEQILTAGPGETHLPKYLETDLDEEENIGSDKSLDESKNSITQISVKNQKEMLHPELEEIRGQSDVFSLPLITCSV
ncbi:hypothetical protein KUTeg_013230 [Tegillarca granosa]|uniref:FERM domain-containing protein n=1 Tax=Tegillarca granosa TaxID=220873 RepID=A0ABQ9EVI3_TEGGR|nr:hypothetical protein KUTeg_013230 [Tegillarca granosa]